MTTPRVTVPVEDLAGKLKAIRDKFLMPTPDKDFTDYAIMTRCVEALSAAPAPEGGAVSIWSDARNVFVRYAELFAMTERYEEASAIADKAAREIEALATREEAPAPCKSCNGSGMDAGSRFNRCPDCCEEAPAEAGEDAIKAACIAWHRAKGSDPFNVLYNGAWCGSFPHQTGPERWTFTVPAMKEAIAAYLRAQPPASEEAPAEAGELRRAIKCLTYELDRVHPNHKTMFVYVADLRVVLSALRAQPSAREDAQPVGRAVEMCGSAGKTSMGIFDAAVVPVGSPLYTHPAPDALRVAVEALEGAKQIAARLDGHDAGMMEDEIEAIDQALAALQAEQKGGA